MLSDIGKPVATNLPTWSKIEYFFPNSDPTDLIHMFSFAGLGNTINGSTFGTWVIFNGWFMLKQFTPLIILLM